MTTDLKTPSDSSKEFCCWITSNLKSIIHAAILPNCTSINKETLWPKLYQFQLSTSFTEKWCSYLKSLQVSTDPVFYQHYTGIIFDNLIKDSIPSIEEKDVCLSALTFEEENAIRYVGGYVLKCLKQGEKDEELLHGINHLTDTNKETKSDSGSDVWIKEINRGGLTNITEEAHQVFLSIEFSIRKYLKLENLYKFNETSRKTIENMVFVDSDVQFSWCLTGISIEVGEEKADTMLEMCIKKWVTICEFSFAKTYWRCTNSIPNLA